MDQTTNAPPIQIANMGDPSVRSLVTTGRINRTSSGTAGTQSGGPRTYMVTSVRSADPLLPANALTSDRNR